MRRQIHCVYMVGHDKLNHLLVKDELGTAHNNIVTCLLYSRERDREIGTALDEQSIAAGCDVGSGGGGATLQRTKTRVKPQKKYSKDIIN